jgi:hypothetical protein
MATPDGHTSNHSTIRSSPTIDPARIEDEQEGKVGSIAPVGVGLDGAVTNPLDLEKSKVKEVKEKEKLQEDSDDVIWVEFEENGMFRSDIDHI